MIGRVEKGDMYVPACEHKGPTGATMILIRPAPCGAVT